MFCIYCGTENEDEARFCQNCGSRIETVRQSTLEGGAYQGPQETAGYAGGFYAQEDLCGTARAAQQAGQEKRSDTKAAEPSRIVGAIKETAGSALFLTAVVIFSLVIVFDLISAFTDSSSVNSVLYDLDLDMAVSSVSGPYIVFSILLLIPAFVNALGLWLIWKAAREHGPYMKTAGLSILKVMRILNIIWIGILAALVLIAGIVLVFATAVGGFEDTGIGARMIAVIVVMVIVICGVLFALMFVFDAKCMKTLESVKRMAISGKITGKLPSFVPVMCIILGVIQAIAAISSVVSLSGIVTAFAQILTAAADILFAITFITFKKSVKAIAQEEGTKPAAPAYAGPSFSGDEAAGPVPYEYGEEVKTKEAAPAEPAYEENAAAKEDRQCGPDAPVSDAQESAACEEIKESPQPEE